MKKINISQEFSEFLCDFILTALILAKKHDPAEITDYVFGAIEIEKLYHSDARIYLCLRALAAVLTSLSDELIQKGITIPAKRCKIIENDIFREVEAEGKEILEGGDIDIESLISKIEDALLKYRKERRYSDGVTLGALLSMLYAIYKD